MAPIKRQLLICLIVCACSLAHLGGCATHTPLDVGEVVVAPQVKLPPPPVLVQQTQPKPVGYFQCLLLNYSAGSCERPTTLTTPMQAAGQTRTP